MHSGRGHEQGKLLQIIRKPDVERWMLYLVYRGAVWSVAWVTVHGEFLRNLTEQLLFFAFVFSGTANGSEKTCAMRGITCDVEHTG